MFSDFAMPQELNIMLSLTCANVAVINVALQRG